MLRVSSPLCLILALAACSLQTSAFVLPGVPRLGLANRAPKLSFAHERPRFVVAPSLQRRKVAPMMMSENHGPSTGYLVAGLVSAVAWLAISYVGLSFHPNPATNAACGLRHNALTMAQAWAMPLPVGWAVFSALYSAASVGWDRLKSQTYRRLNLAVVACSLWLAAAAAFGPAFAVGYDLFSLPLKVGAATVHSAVALFALSVWVRTVKGDYFGRLYRGMIGSLWSLAPKPAVDDPDKSDGGAALYAFAAAGLLVFAILPQCVSFPMATIPAILGKRLSRAASGFTLMAAVASYCLKDAAERGRIHASTFVTLRKGLAVGAFGHLLVIAMKVAGVDGGGLLFPGGGLWEFYPSMVGAPKAAAASCLVYSTLFFACASEPPAPDDQKGSPTS